jgi:hypothetical protein
MIQINKRSIHGSSFTVRQVRWTEMGWGENKNKVMCTEIWSPSHSTKYRFLNVSKATNHHKDFASLGEEPSPGFPAGPICWSSQNTDTHYRVGTELVLPLLLFWKVIYGQQEMLSVWVHMNERNGGHMWQFSDQNSLSLQVSTVMCNWWSLGAP